MQYATPLPSQRLQAGLAPLYRLTAEPAQSQLLVFEKAEAVAAGHVRQRFELAPDAEVDSFVHQTRKTFDVELPDERLHDVADCRMMSTSLWLMSIFRLSNRIGSRCEEAGCAPSSANISRCWRSWNGPLVVTRKSLPLPWSSIVHSTACLLCRARPGSALRFIVERWLTVRGLLPVGLVYRELRSDRVLTQLKQSPCRRKEAELGAISPRRAECAVAVTPAARISRRNLVDD
jgi:hypothetical protein